MTNAGNLLALPLGPNPRQRAGSCSHVVLRGSSRLLLKTFIFLPFSRISLLFFTWRRDKTPLGDEMSLLDIWQMTEHGFQFTDLLGTVPTLTAVASLTHCQE